MSTEEKNKENNRIDFSYNQLRLLSFLKESHPELASDIELIKMRADSAAKVFERESLSGSPYFICTEAANEELFAGLHFSKHDTIEVVLEREFSAEVPVDQIRETAIRLLPALEETFADYPLSDEFAGDPLYDKLYTELTGAIQLKYERDGKL